MPLTSTVLFNVPQQEIASLIIERMSRATTISVVTGFATPGGLTAIAAPLQANPQKLNALVVGAATYPAFEALDELLAAGVPPDRLLVHLGHTSESGSRKNPFVRFHPMLHSKVYYTELPGSSACAFIGSHNLTSYALTGVNGEAAVMLEGPVASPEFEKVRNHIQTAREQAEVYSSGMKEAYAWWMREYIDGLRAEVRIPQDWVTVRTILLFARAAAGDRPKSGDHLYFEIPAGIEQIESLKTETHLFLFDTLPADPWQALRAATNADALFTCVTLGAENKQGNREVVAHWRIDGSKMPALARVPAGVFRPNTASGMQQVRAEVQASRVKTYEYLFDRLKMEWTPMFSDSPAIYPARISEERVVLREALGDNRADNGWKLVKGLTEGTGPSREKDEAALRLVAPESGSFILVSLRRRLKDSHGFNEKRH